MTLDHVAATYRVPEDELIARLKLPPDTNRNESLKAIADRRAVARFDFVRQVQRAIGEANTVAPPAGAPDAQSAGELSDRILSALLIYGYPALAATLLLGAIGLPLPIGVATVLAGSLAAIGNLRWEWAAAIAVVASLAGDIIAYGIGRTVSGNFLARHGRWIAYSPQRLDRMQALLQRWGGITVIVSRTLTSSLSSLVNAASQFLGNLSGLIIALGVLVIASGYRAGLLQPESR